MKPSKNIYHIEVFICYLLFSLSFIWSKQALDYLHPITLILFRVIIATVVLVSVALLKSKLQRVRGRDLLWVTALSMAQPVGYFIFENGGLMHVSPTLACLIIGLIPVFTPFAAYLVNKERVSKYSWWGLLVSFSGVVVVTLSDGTETLSGNIYGILLLMGAVLSAVVYIIILQRLSRKFNSITIISYINIIAIVFLIPLSFIFDFEGITTLTYEIGWLYPVLMLGVLCSAVAYFFNAEGIRQLGATTTTLYINLMPGMTAIASYIILDEHLSWMKIVGIMISISGLFVANRAPKNSLT